MYDNNVIKSQVIIIDNVNDEKKMIKQICMYDPKIIKNDNI